MKTVMKTAMDDVQFPVLYQSASPVYESHENYSKNHVSTRVNYSVIIAISSYLYTL